MNKPTTLPKYKVGDRLVFMHEDTKFVYPLDDNMVVEGEAQWNTYGKGYWEYPIKGKANNCPEDFLVPYVEGQKEYR